MSIKLFFSNRATLAKLRMHPLGKYMNSYAKHLKERGYDDNTCRWKIRTVARWSPWLKRHGIAVRDLRSEHIERYLRMKVRKTKPITQDDEVVLRQFLEFLRSIEAVPRGVASSSSGITTEDLGDKYALYLKRERALSSATVVHYKRLVQRFLCEITPEGNCDFSRFNPMVIASYVSKAGSNQSRKYTKLVTSALRSFFRFARYQGFVDADLDAAVPSVANWAISIPKALPVDQVQQMLSSCDRDTIIGQRDYAILLLLARLGLRAGEVISLQLEDIDWRAGCISIHGKGSNLTQMPLPPDVGNAISSYLRCRPQSGSRFLFLRSLEPFTGLCRSSSVSSIVRDAFRRAGIDSERQGAHQFRHTLATELLRNGASMEEIAELLRHQSVECTTIYAKVDLVSLQAVGLPWPGGATK